MGRDKGGHSQLARKPSTIAFDADDTLWQNEQFFRMIQGRFSDLLDQESKLAQSGLGECFDGVEIVSNKTPAIYAEIFSRHGGEATRAMMVGNSMRQT